MVTPFVTAPYVARVLGADGIGIYSYAQAYMTYFSMMAALGTGSYGAREIARCRENKREYSKKFWEIELLSVFTTSLSLTAWIVLVLLSAKYRIYFIALIPTLIATMLDISWFYAGHEKFGYTVFWNSLCKIAGVISIFTFVKDKNDLTIYIFLYSFISMLGNGSMWIFLPKMLVKVDPRQLRFKHHLQETLVYFVPTISTTIYTVLDKTLIGAITQDNYQNGYYEQATKIINMAKSAVFVSVNTVMSTRISYLFSQDKKDEIKAKISKSINFILFLGVAVAFGIIAVAKDFVPVFFGDGYEPVINLLYWMSPLILIIGVSNCLGSQYYTPAGLRAQSSKYIITGSVVNLIMNLILIPKFKATGAVIGSIVAELTITILYFKNCSGYITTKQIFNYSYRRLLAGVIMILTVKLIGTCNKIPGILLLICEVIGGTTIYFTSLYLMRDTMLEEIVLLIKKKAKNNG